MSALSPAGRKMSGYTASASDSEATEELGAVWLAYKWDALQPLAGCGALSALLTVTTLQSPTSGPCNALAACCVEGRLGAMWSGCAVCCACSQLPPRMWAAVDCCIPGRRMAGTNTQTRYWRALPQDPRCPAGASLLAVSVEAWTHAWYTRHLALQGGGLSVVSLKALDACCPQANALEGTAAVAGHIWRGGF